MSVIMWAMAELLFLYMDTVIRLALFTIVSLLILARIRSRLENKLYTWRTVLVRNEDDT